MSVAVPEATVLNGQVAGEVIAGVAGGDISEVAILEANMPPSIDANGGAVSVVYNGSVAVGNRHKLNAYTNYFLDHIIVKVVFVK